MTRFVTIGKFHELTGYGEDAVRSKIARADWREGLEFVKAPDNRILMDMEGYEKWVLGLTAFELPRKAPSKSTSTTGVRAAASG